MTSDLGLVLIKYRDLKRRGIGLIGMTTKNLRIFTLGVIKWSGLNREMTGIRLFENE